MRGWAEWEEIWRGRARGEGVPRRDGRKFEEN